MSLRPADRLHVRFGSVLETGPAVEPVTVDEMMPILGLDYSGSNAILLGDFIVEARQEIEDAIGLAMIDQTWRLSLDGWPGREEWWDGVRDGSIAALGSGAGSVILPRWPLSNITSVTTYDDAGASTAVTVASVFDVDVYQRPGRLMLKSGQAWPTALRDTNAVQIVYVAGFGATASTVPAPLKRAIRSMVAYMFGHRGDACDAGDAFVKSGAADLVGRYKVARV